MTARVGTAVLGSPVAQRGARRLSAVAGKRNPGELRSHGQRLLLRDCFAQRWFIIIGLLVRVVYSGVVNDVSQFGGVVCLDNGGRNLGGGAAV